MTPEQIRAMLLNFEAFVVAAQQRFTNDEILRFVALTLEGRIRNGAFTPDYVQAADDARSWRRIADSLTTDNAATGIIRSGFQPSDQ